LLASMKPLAVGVSARAAFLPTREFDARDTSPGPVRTASSQHVAEVLYYTRNRPSSGIHSCPKGRELLLGYLLEIEAF
jgi:hypothetical protein